MLLRVRSVHILCKRHLGVNWPFFARNRCEDFRKDCRRAIPECKWNFFRECLVTWLSCWRFSCERMKQDYTEAMEASKMSQEERVPGSPEAMEEQNATGLSTSFPAQ